MDDRRPDGRQRDLLRALDGALSLSDLGDASVLRPQAEELVAQGWLRKSDAPDSYALTADGHLVLAGPLDVTLYTRPGCHLCDEAKSQIAPLLRRAGARLHEVNIDADDVLRQRYNVDVPVLFLGARKVAKHRVDLQQFQRQLAEAGRLAKASGG